MCLGPPPPVLSVRIAISTSSPPSWTPRWAPTPTATSTLPRRSKPCSAARLTCSPNAPSATRTFAGRSMPHARSSMTDAVKKRLLDALAACGAIRGFTEGIDFTAYERALLVRSGVERQFEIIGEALNRATDEDPALTDDLPDLRRIVGLRNRLIHGYDSVDDE